MVIFTVVDAHLTVLLTLRDVDPYNNCWSLPGGIVGADESADTSAVRQLHLKAGVSDVYLEQLYTFTEPNRDPRSRVVSLAYYALVSPDKLQAEGTRQSRWFKIGTLDDDRIWLDQREAEIPLAFDHQKILQTAIKRIRGKLAYTPIGFQLLPEKFTLTELQQVYEAILGQKVDKRNFRAKVLRSGQLTALDSFKTGSHRPARLYTFVDRVF